jgi:hypothetical protein
MRSNQPDALREEVPGYRITDPETSKAAFENVCIPQREQDVLDALMSLGGSGADEEIADVLSAVYSRQEIPSNVSPRIKPLMRKGLVERASYKHKSRQGQMCRVSKLTLEGQHRATAFRYEADCE